MNNGLEQTLIIESKSKLLYQQGYLVVESKEEKQEYCLNNIDCIIIVSKPASLISSSLLVETMNRNINIIVLDNKHNPCLNLLPMYGTYNSCDMLLKQIDWQRGYKSRLFGLIIKNKIGIEDTTLINKGLEKNKIFDRYLTEIKQHDDTNREGLVAKMYFTRLFGSGFNRRDNSNIINSFLNYGYSLIVSFMNQEIVKHGYRTELGIHHCNKTNNFNLTYDLFEPFRSIVDEYVYDNKDVKELTYDMKIKMLEIFERKVQINNKKYTLKEGIRYFIIKCLNYLEGKNSIYPKVNYIYE